MITVDSDSGEQQGVRWAKTPETDVEILRLLYKWRDEVNYVHCCIERIIPGAFFGIGKGSAASLYGSYRAWCMACAAAKIEVLPVDAKVWQAEAFHPGKPPKTKDPKQRSKVLKAALKKRAEECFPTLSITLATCDALLIARYCDYIYGGSSNGSGSTRS